MSKSLLNLLQEYRVVIPIMQRDYAQGREIGKAPAIRERFLISIFTALKENRDPLELDFVYGLIKPNDQTHEESKHNFVPLDGQQRLTTLFLLHWYVAAKEDRLSEAKKHLNNFTYETRHSSRVFCSELLDKFEPEEFDKSISDTITNQYWFFSAWQNDPTISSMLVMLDAIQEKYRQFEVEDVWLLLTAHNPKIVFHLLPMEDLVSADDLYIKMNSRGKELTKFEYFKSQFSEILPKELSAEFNAKIDQSWSELFWKLYKNEASVDIATLVDNGFLRFFRYITDMHVSRNSLEIETTSNDLIEICKDVYCEAENAIFLFTCLDAFSVADDTFFDNLFYIDTKDFEVNRTRLFFLNPENNLFKKCSSHYDTSQRNNPFSIGEQLLLYACIEHLIYKTDEFDKRIRLLSKLVNNSEDTVRKENMPSLLITVSGIVTDNTINETSRFNRDQIEEEGMKQIFIQRNVKYQEAVQKLEDHHLLQGCLAVFELDDRIAEYASVFALLFSQDYLSISSALLTVGDYSRSYSWCKRFGNHNQSVWRELLTPSQRRKGFENTKNILNSMMARFLQCPEKMDTEEIISGYLSMFLEQKDKPKDCRYYFVRYPEFREENDDGFYYWKDIYNQYECIKMRRSTLGGFHWSPFLYALKKRLKYPVSLDNYGAPLLLSIDNATLKMTNVMAGFVLEAYDDEESKSVFTEIQKAGLVDSNGIYETARNADGVDIEDRIENGLVLISKIYQIVLPQRLY